MTTPTPGYVVYDNDIPNTPVASEDLIATTAGNGASLVGIQDTGGYYTSATVEGALQEVFTSRRAYAEKTTTYPVTSADGTINCTSGTFTVTLPTAIGCQGQVFNIKNSGTGVITVATTSVQNIDDVTTLTLQQWENLTIQSTGSNWIIL